MKKLVIFIFTLLLTSNIFAQSLEILQPLQMIENSSVMVQYKNRYGKHNMPDKDIPFPFALICIRLEGSGTEVTAAQQVVDLFMGSQTMAEDVERNLVNEIQFLVPTSAKNMFLRCGNGCQEQVLASGVRLRPNTVYYCQVKYTPEEIEYGPKKPVITSQYLLINVTPSNAIVEVDGNLWTTNNGVAGNLLDFGEHHYRVSAPDYASSEGKVMVNDPENTQSITVALKPRFCSVTFKVENNAEIWINGTKKGSGQWTGNLGYGPYRIETKLSGHIDGMVQQTITETDANRTFTLPTPTPIYGSLRVETQPFQADIYLDGKNVGKTPKMLPEVIIGNHKIEVKMEGYENLSTTQAITEGQMAVVGGELTAKPNTEKTSTPNTYSTVVYSRKDFFPIDGITLGLTTRKEAKKMGLKVEYKGDRDWVTHSSSGLSFWDFGGWGRFNYLSISHYKTMPSLWKDRGMSFEMSWNEWLEFFKNHGFSVTITTSPTTKTYSGRSTLSGAMKATSADRSIQFRLDFNYGNSHGEGYSVTSKNTLYSIVADIAI